MPSGSDPRDLEIKLLAAGQPVERMGGGMRHGRDPGTRSTFWIALPEAETETA